MNTIYKIETGEYVNDIDPLELTSIEGEAMLFTEQEIDSVLEVLGGSFAPGRPGDRNGPKK